MTRRAEGNSKWARHNASFAVAESLGERREETTLKSSAIVVMRARETLEPHRK